MFGALEVKTSYSILSSLNRIDMLVKKAEEYNYSFLTLTDVNNMFGAYEFYLACKNSNIKPLIGIEIKDKEKRFILIAKNNNGYKNLIKLSTLVSEREITKEDLKIYHKDIILIMPYSDYNKDITSIFEDYFIGYSRVEERDNIHDRYVFINDISYIEREDYKYLDYAFMIRDDKKIGEIELGNYKGKYLLKKEEFAIYVDDKALNNMKYIYDNCNVTFEYKDNLLPIYDQKINSYEYLKSLSYKGIKKRLNNNVSKEYVDRLNYELDVINKTGFCDYFLVVWDYVKYAKFNSILVGPGRGSAAGSLVSYAIGITEVDPIKYNLLFERFLNPERITMPDIDIDFDSEKRNLVTDYVTEKYGSKKVAGIITFNTLGAKQVIRDLGRCMDISLPIIDEVAKTITSKSLEETYNNKTKFYRLINSRDELKKLYKIALKLEGLQRHISVHAAGIVMSRSDIDEVIPLYKNQLGMYITGFSMNYLEPLGLLKMDFLGLDNLTLMDNVMKDIREKEGINITFDKVPLDDKKTLKIFYDADTDGIFQFEQPGMKRFLSKLKIKSFDDIALALALYRPGPMDNIDSFIKRREGKEKISYIHPVLEDILKPTYGIIVYQEQIMQIVQRLAGYSYGEADILRRAMSKKKVSIMEKEKPKFIEGAIKNGYTKEVAEEVYELILKFANYGFNKAHSVSYAIISYKMAFVKTYFLNYFLTGLLTNAIGNNDKTNIYLTKAKASGIEVLPPDINKSEKRYIIEGKAIRCPLSIISSVGTSVSNDIIREREKGDFTDFSDFVLRMHKSSVNRKVLVNLINAGAISFGYNKRTLIENIDRVLNYAEVAGSGGIIVELKPEIEEYDDYSKKENIDLELKTLGFYLTNHPASKYINNYKVNSTNYKDYFDKNVKLAIMINNIKETTTKNNDVMAFIRGSDGYGEIDFTIFPTIYKKFNNINNGDVVEIWGKVEKRYDRYQIIINNIIGLE